MDPELDACLRRWRAALHSRPELAFREFRTQEFIARELRAMGLQPHPIAGTGLLADIRFPSPGPCIGFRADLDALPFPREGHAPAGGRRVRYRPVHACGHDMHSAILLGLARSLLPERERLRGTVRLIFQPAEERLSERSGARRCIEDGALEDPLVAHLYALHVTPRFPVGTVACRPGPFMAESHRVEIEAAGAGGHGADPSSADPVLALARILVAVSAQLGPSGEGHVAFCQLEGGTAPNLRPARVRAAGTLRSTRPGVADGLLRKLRDCVAAAAATMPAVAVTVSSTPAYGELRYSFSTCGLPARLDVPQPCSLLIQEGTLGEFGLPVSLVAAARPRLAVHAMQVAGGQLLLARKHDAHPCLCCLLLWFLGSRILPLSFLNASLEALFAVDAQLTAERIAQARDAAMAAGCAILFFPANGTAAVADTPLGPHPGCRCQHHPA